MDSPKDLPPFPPKLRMSEDGSHGIYGDLKFHPSMHLSMLLERQTDMVTALRARLALAVDALQEARQYVYDYGSERSMAPVVERIDKTIAACREPDHG